MQGRPLAPGLEALPEGPEGTSAEVSVALHSTAAVYIAEQHCLMQHS